MDGYSTAVEGQMVRPYRSLNVRDRRRYAASEKVSPSGFEPLTFGFGGRRAVQLCHGDIHYTADQAIHLPDGGVRCFSLTRLSPMGIGSSASRYGIVLSPPDPQPRLRQLRDSRRNRAVAADDIASSV